MKTVSRSAGRSVVAAAAYRLGERLHEQGTAQVHDYSRRHGVEAAFTVAPADAPPWAHDPERLWNAADRAEKRINSTLAREVELALPDAVSAEARTGIASAFADVLVERYGVAVSVAIHAPGKEGDQRNHHAHILFTTREMTPEGLGQKTRVLDDKKTGAQEVIYLRALACDLINAALEDADSGERVDHRSFAARGIEREPTGHLGPSATALERREETSERGDLNREIMAANTAPTGEEAAPGEAHAQPFERIHAATVRQAQADLSAAQAQESAGDGRLARMRAWLGNMQAHVSEWREQLEERVSAIYGRLMPDRTPETGPPEQEPER